LYSAWIVSRKEKSAITGFEEVLMKILCVESQTQDMQALTFMLHGIGYEVMPALNGGQALDVLQTEAIDGVLLEYNLPDQSGVTLRTKLKAIRPDVPILLFTGVGSQTPFMLRFFDAYLRHGRAFSDDVDL
jgi:response regulator RpfG family c-di-GMP phosphodiesterase